MVESPSSSSVLAARSSSAGSHVMLGESAAMHALRQEVDWAARSGVRVLVTGPSGVGKELVAQAIHRGSARAQRPLVAVNCAGVPDSLLESELFGHTRGSFTGAVRDRAGLLEAANGGTLFLDEVGEMSLRMQALLLRFLENGEVQRVGADRERYVSDVRVIAATNRNLRDHIAAGQFREDLFYRLNVIHIVVPPLRERREDVAVLVRAFLGHFAKQYGVEPPMFDEDAMAAVRAYDWPGNVRELRNFVERLVVRHPGGRLRVDSLPHDMRYRPAPTPAHTLPATKSVADALFDQMVVGGQSFWSVVYTPFASHDLTRDHLREIVRKGLSMTHGSYKALLQLFNMKPDDYKSFLGFLRKHGCHMPFQEFRTRMLRASVDGRAGGSDRAARRVGGAA